MFITNNDINFPFQFNYSGNSSQQIISGRIITLGVGYYNASNMIVHTCVLLKMQGEIKCPFSLSLPTAAPSRTEPPFSSATVESSLSTSTRSANNPNVHTTSGGPSTTIISTATKNRSITAPQQTSAPMVIKTSAKHSSSNGRSGLIAGVFAGAIGLLVLVIAIILVRRRKKRETVAKKSGVVAGPKTDVTNSKHGSSASSQPHISNISENPVYEQPKKPQIQVGAIHNILEPVYAKVEKRASEPPSDERVEPFYNVLEGPETDGPNEKEPPFYHLLEGPYSDGGPFYDVLEEPGSMALPNQHNASITIIDGKTDGKGNRDYKDTVYDSVEEVIPDTGDIYQQLNQDGQRETSVC
ncbi:uncharacterized protein LOC116307072 isoform X1 [Actinia tenebrosa]|uniref:Uncharacterized protein LOC116307072 isoform X1 n=1 Tax=Actinia tenebrosa TaxID=6105 RepID=A0A6P8J517_ACTTE|nr:uncharacterized protein LOC116307072 isoform X1 [Actinia tenebrosa]